MTEIEYINESSLVPALVGDAVATVVLFHFFDFVQCGHATFQGVLSTFLVKALLINVSGSERDRAWNIRKYGTAARHCVAASVQLALAANERCDKSRRPCGCFVFLCVVARTRALCQHTKQA